MTPQGVKGLHRAGGLGSPPSAVQKAQVLPAPDPQHGGMGDESGQALHERAGVKALLQQGQAPAQAKGHRPLWQAGPRAGDVLAVDVPLRRKDRRGVVVRKKPTHKNLLGYARP